MAASAASLGRPAKPAKTDSPQRSAPKQQPSLTQQHLARLQPVGAVAQPQHQQHPGQLQREAAPPVVQQREALLCQRFKAHTSALTAALVLTDTGDHQQIITASLDKSVALWSAQGSAELPEHSPADGPLMCIGGLEGSMRIALPGAPVFSLALDSEAVGSGRRQVFAGTAAKAILAWEPPQPQAADTVVLDGHTGWVRALATHGRWLFSCSCNTVRQWDMSRAVPRLVRDFKCGSHGDILAACTGNSHLFTAGANGVLRSFAIIKTGEAARAFTNKAAHTDRITGVAWHKGFLYTASADGSLRMWDATLEQVAVVKAAHEGGKINCLAVGPDGVIYTGGDDKLIRRWQSGVTPAGLLPEAAPALFCHHAPVRTLAAGSAHTIVSGDSRGDVAVWRV